MLWIIQRNIWNKKRTSGDGGGVGGSRVYNGSGGRGGVVMVEEGEDGEKMKVEEEQKEKDEECVFIL